MTRLCWGGHTLWFADIAVAGDGWVDLRLPVDFPSAIDEQDPAEEELQLRARWGVRPWLGFTILPGESGGWGGTVGVAVAHQWWSLRKRAVMPAGETRLRVAGPFGGVQGWDIDLDSAAGAWFGPVGALGGLAVRADRSSWHGGVVLSPALAIGPEARLAAKVGPVTPWLAVSPSWIIAGDRAGLGGPWSEFTTEFGAAIQARPLEVRVAASRHATSAGGIWEAAVGFHFKIL